MELRDVSHLEKKSALAEDFAEVMKDVHDQVKNRLHHTTKKYKAAADKKRRDLKFKVGDLVMLHLKKERLPKEKYTKLMMKKLGPCKILMKCGNNAYKVDLPSSIGLSPIFNVADLYPYKGSVDDFFVAGELDFQQDEYSRRYPSHPC
ncbi:uncharacterized protein LOC131859466 [Cryptomeria japonica]|uniref:uncharacterized protein LOC131859466 n=1 Tax=Cryptomeria japonica TaxID=3369 RepID=UPI0027DA6A29|nr:uncharacterized protein LOC131859466 [Cryptomeria japonica]